MTNYKYSTDDLLYLMARLRDPQTGCPWDIKQDYGTIAPSTLEEAYEVVEAIEKKNYDDLKSELGDLLLHVVFHTIIASESNGFTIDDVIDSIQSKLIRRHPHVFGDVKVSGAQEVKKNWEEIKVETKW